MRHILLLLSLTLLPELGFCLSDLEFERLNSNDGLSTEELRNIFQDSEGYIWFLTREGLNRYDGYEFKIYKQGNSDLSFPSSAFESICEDQEGRLWLGSYEKGVSIFDKYENLVISFEEEAGGISLFDNHIRSLLCDRSGNIWIGTEYGMYKYNPEIKSLDHFNLGDLESKEPAWCIVEDLMEDSEGKLWIATWSEGLFLFDNNSNSLKNLREFDGNPYTQQGNQIKTIFQDNLGYIWIGTWEDGLYMTRYENEKLTIERTYLYDDYDSQSISGNIIYSINQDFNNNIWVGTPYGLTIIEGSYSEKPHFIREVYRYGSEKGLCNNEVWKIVKDRSGLMWIATLEGGVNKVHPGGRIFDSYSIPPVSSQIQSQTTQAFCMDPLGNFLVGVKSLGFGKYDLNRNIYIPYKEFWPYSEIPFEINTVKCFQTMGDELWLGTRYQGLIIFDTRINRYIPLYDIDSTYIPYDINILTPASDTSMWIGTQEGLYLATRSREAYQVERIGGLKGNRIKSILLDSEENIWIGTEESGISLLQLHGSAFKPAAQFHMESGNIESNHINCIYQDSRGQIWAGTTDQGLLKYNPESKDFTKALVLINSNTDAIMSMLEDADGKLWLTTNGGIIRVYSWEGSLKSDNYTVADGLQGNNFLPNSLYQLNSNRIFAGGYYGFNAFYPSSVRQNDFIPATVITGISVNNKSLAPKEYINKPLSLKYNQNNLDISISSLSYHKSEKNVFAYKLEEVNPEWQYIDASQRKLKFSNLKTGTYSFLVKSANSSEIWNEKPEILEFEILAAPYKTWWAILIYLMVFLLLLIGLFRFLLKNERIKRAYELEKIEHARAEKLNQFKLRFFTNISHELLTPLSIMYCSIDLLRSKTRKGKPELTILERNMNQLKRLLSQLLDFRKMESGHLKLQVQRNNLSEFIGAIVEDFKPLANNMQLDLRLETAGSIQMGYFDEDKLNKALHNLLSNAIKYTPPGGMIVVYHEIINKARENWASIRVTDSGVGIPPEGLKHVFERFYRAEIDKEETGTGIGLSLTRNLIELHHGTIQVSSEIGKGTVFSIEIPVHQSAYQSNEIQSVDVNKVIFGDQEEEAPKLTEDSTRSAGETKILLAEDNPDFRQILQTYFSKRFHVIEAANGDQALQKAIKYHPDIIVSDVMMPGITGYELCSELKNNIETNTIPVILLTAKAADSDLAEGYRSGADSFITKPVSLPVLDSRIKSLLMKKVSPEPVPEESLQEHTPNPRMNDEQFIRLLKKVITQNLSDSEFHVRDLHIQFGMSSSKFYRRVKELTKLAPVEYLKHFRLNRAAVLIKKGSTNMAEVAYETGFSDQSYFGVCFKKQFGTTPSAYKRS